ncbi:MAG: hypothetical protein KTR24_11035 [Saprospiraceae bacterium]|nr:hypothetical protein [Saprospiraceae bacterium]
MKLQAYRTVGYPAVLFVLLCQVAALQGQEYAALLQQRTAAVPVEKIYVSIDRPSYLLGDTIRCTAFMLEGHSLQPFEAQPLIKAQWLAPDGKLLQEFDIKIVNGIATFDIPTFTDEVGGEHVLRVFSLYQLNFNPAYIFQKRIVVGSLPIASSKTVMEDSLHLRFYPEGGHLVVGNRSRVAATLYDHRDNPVSAKIEIGTSKGDPRMSVNTDAFGRAFFDLDLADTTPLIARIAFQGDTLLQSLPSIKKRGVSISVSTEEPLQIVCDLRSSDDLDNYVLVAHMRGEVFLEYSCPHQKQLSLRLDRSDLPDGLIHFTLFDPSGNPIVERLVANVRMRPAIELFATTEASSNALNIDIKGVETPSQSTVSVYQTLDPYSTVGDDIVSYLLFQSDLTKPWSTTALQRFDPDELDDLLLLYGWSRFSWPALSSNRSLTVRFPQRESYVLAGKTTLKRNGEAIEAQVTCTIFKDSSMQIVSSNSSPEGLFLFENLNFPDSTEVLIKATSLNPGKKKKFRDELVVELLDLQGEELMDSLVKWPTPMKKTIVASGLDPIEIDSSLWNIDLEEVTVRARLSRGQERALAVKKRYREKGFFYIPSTPKFILEQDFADSKYPDMYSLIRTVFPQAKIVREGGFPKIIYGRLSSGSEVTIVIDGFIRRPEALFTIDPYTIEIAEYLDELQAGALGYNSNPALFFTTKDEIKKSPSSSLAVSYPGYYSASQSRFSADCDAYAQSQGYSKTLYWSGNEPLLNEKLSITSCGPQEGYSCYVKIEGITREGVPFFHFSKILD